ncbi:glycosyltransferase family 2 protein [Maritalea mediterranea]|uniref:Glycosyltransferase n=1 Tax=Maritalea mediterranea TaxID=2909667 RepID=A0ABS9E446_9HYPH|nr:glycosyltransferase family 2 protein [Maritalea mediterranea]MCF4097640.1 glycosyltransferase [Maritalea mediterranea]
MIYLRTDLRATDLLQQLLAPFRVDRYHASALISHAETQNLDVLHVCAARYGIAETTLYARAAEILGLAYHPTVPPGAINMPQIDRLEFLPDMRQIRGKVFDRELIFAAPSLERLVALHARLKRQPELRSQICIVPLRALRQAVQEAQNPTLYDAAIQRLARVWPRASAHLGLGDFKRFLFLGAVLFVAVLSAWDPPVLEIVIFWFLALLYLSPAAFRLYASLYGLMLGRSKPPRLLGDAELPTYSVLVPLRDEAALVPQLARALKALNYPPEKLDIKLVVESVSVDTIAAVEAELNYLPFQLVTVPDGAPRTKPKAINFALPLARGDHIVVFDAEDIPHPDQLRLAATLFAQQPEIDCFQAELVIDNGGETALTALFTTEYATQFGLIMPALADLAMPMPLGGTSNHFRITSLRHVGGWDSYNVTEDADLGLRLARIGMRCGMLPSTTREEAPINIWPWVRQRTRWMKGWMQTLLVHSSELRLLHLQLGWRDFLFFYLYIGGMVFAAPMHGIFLVKFVSEVLIYQAELPARLAHAWPYFIVLSMTYGSALIIGILGLIRAGKPLLIFYQLLLPLYWILTSVATLRAAWQLAFDPFGWEKTTHGKTRVMRTLWPRQQNRTKRWRVKLRRARRQFVLKGKRPARPID